MATIKEIAQRCGVAIGTVDRVLHGRGRVSAETAERVRRIADELGFKPNPFARNLSVSREWNFGLLTPREDQDSGYWRLPRAGAESAAASLAAYRVSVTSAHFDRYDRGSFLRAHAELVAAGVDGILMAPVLSAAAVEALDGGPGMPHVAFDTELEHALVASSIGQDSYRSGRLAARLMRLCMGGSGKVAVMAPDADNRHIGERVRGIREELGLEAEIAVSPHESKADAYVAVLGPLLGAPGGPRGLIVADATTRIAAKAIESLSLRGIKLIGFDLQEEDGPFLESGAIDFLITQAPRRQGELGLRQLFRLLVLAEECEKRIAMPIDAVTRENYLEHLEPRGYAK